MYMFYKIFMHALIFHRMN